MLFYILHVLGVLLFFDTSFEDLCVFECLNHKLIQVNLGIELSSSISIDLNYKQMTSVTRISNFDGSNTGYLPYRTSFLDAAAHASATQHGVLGFILLEADYLLLPGVIAPFVPAEHPGAQPAAGAQFPLWHHNVQAFHLQQQCLASFTVLFLQSLDASSLALLEDGERGTRFRTLAEMFAILEGRYGTITPAELLDVLASLSLPFSSGSVRAHIEKHDRANRLCRTAGLVLADLHRMIYLQCSVRDTPSLRGTLDFYSMTYPTNADQTYARLVLALQRAEDARLGTAASLGYAAAATTAPKKVKTSNGTRFCWTHGTGYHDGLHCNNPAPGHVKEATSRIA